MIDGNGIFIDTLNITPRRLPVETIHDWQAIDMQAYRQLYRHYAMDILNTFMNRYKWKQCMTGRQTDSYDTLMNTLNIFINGYQSKH